MAASITTEDIGKCYRIGHETNRRYPTLRDGLVDGLRSLVSRRRSDIETFWALRGVSIEIPEGQKVGIIGRNGAGKSTLLKLLSRITQPTEGRIRLRGRVVSLLEVGTGFHPELTGRENIFLNGAILGMKRREIERKFDEIVAFAGVEKFLDTPVKRYSSGMYVRLAFAVASHLEADVLLVDEVLAVGDMAFQKKCVGRMDDLASKGRTVVIVSHNMQAISHFCERVLTLADGKVVADGVAKDVIAQYVASQYTGSSNVFSESVGDDGARRSGTARFKSIRLLDRSNGSAAAVPMGDSLEIEVVESPVELGDCSIGVGISDELGRRVATLTSLMLTGYYLALDASTDNVFVFSVASLPLLEGTYHVSLFLVASQKDYLDRVEHAASFNVVPQDVYGKGRIPARGQGTVFLNADFLARGGEAK